MDNKISKRITPTNGVNIIVNREFVGIQSIEDAFVPIIYEDIKKQIDDNRTFDFPERAS